MEFLEVRNLKKIFDGVVAVANLHFTAQKGEILAIIGPNGAGKSTTFNLLSGLFLPDAGEIRFAGREITGAKPHERCLLGIGRTFQVCRPFLELSVLENVATAYLFGRHPRPSLARAREGAAEVLARVGLAAKLNLFPAQLTAPDLKMLELARALATGPHLLLLDEVMAGLLPPECLRVMELVREIRAEGVTVILVEHVMKVVRELAERVIVMDYGQKICEGTYAEIAADPRVIAAYLGQEEGTENAG